jgi:hypothetical protein
MCVPSVANVQCEEIELWGMAKPDPLEQSAQCRTADNRRASGGGQ